MPLFSPSQNGIAGEATTWKRGVWCALNRLGSAFLRSLGLSVSLLAAVAAGPGVAGAVPQDDGPDTDDPDRPEGPGDKRIAARRVDGDLEIDGRLIEDAWDLADAASGFLQREPGEGDPASERTEVRILYDDSHLYLGVVAHDSQPGRITATDRRRDSGMDTEDTVTFVLDTFHDHRNGFLFRVNPLGTKWDALLRDEQSTNSQWDEEWFAAARITASGWEVEIAIPWNSLRYPTGSNTWGFDVQRRIRRRNEEVVWSNYRQDFDFNQVSQAGHLVGLQDLQLTDRFRLKPFVTGGLTDRNITSTPDTENLLDAGLEDLKWQIHPGLVLDVTANTDFGQVEVDQAQVNLTRFSLFLPEQREFFLEGRDNFDFGATGGFGSPDALLFYSRRIGLSEAGAQLPLDAAAKLTGKVGGLTIGALDAQTGDTAGAHGNNLGVVRLQHDVLARSRVGVLFTNRSGGGTFNRVMGVDGDFTFHDHLGISGFAARSTDTQLDDPEWIGQGSMGWDSDTWTLTGDFLRISPEFVADLAFIPRRGLEKTNLRAGWRPRPGLDWLRQLHVVGTFTQIDDTSGGIETRTRSIYHSFNLDSGDRIVFDFNDNFERLDSPFEIRPGVLVPPGDHQFQDYRLEFQSYSGRPVSVTADVTVGGFWTGDRTAATLSPAVRLGRSVQASLTYEYNDVQLPQGAFHTHLVNSRVSYSFNERWLTDAMVQWSSTSDRVTLFARLNWLYRANDDLFVVYRQTAALDGDFSGRRDHRLVFKLTRSFDF